MKTTSILLCTIGLLWLSSTSTFADKTHKFGSPGRPDGHAPIGVMGDHMHKEGGLMLSHRFMRMEREGMGSGTRSLSRQDVFNHGFDRSPTDMQMDMHMFGIMYAPSDHITFMGMLHYSEKEMNMVSGSASSSGHTSANEHATETGHMNHAKPVTSGHTDESGQGVIEHGGHAGGRHHHSTRGVGDTTLTALYQFWSQDDQSAHFGLGIGFPTADVEEKMGGRFQPYGMQLGNGVWDLRPSLTWLGKNDHWSWGSQISARINLDDENDAGFAYGNELGATVWGARKLADAVSLSGRFQYAHQDDIEGQYRSEGSHRAPPFLTENYGGEVLNAGIGLNLIGTSGVLRGHRLAAEVLLPVHEDLNGIQLQRDYSLIIGWQKAF